MLYVQLLETSMNIFHLCNKKIDDIDNYNTGWLVSLVIGEYLAWFGEHLLG